jgi:DNA-binding NarL/FixJ family response regulator
MNIEKIKRKIAEGLKNEEIASMSGISVEEITKLRNSDLPKTGGTSTSKANPKKPTPSYKKIKNKKRA